MNSNRIVVQERRQHIARGSILTGIGIALGLTLMSASEARASTYRVYTASAANSMTLNANDGVCTLAEAVQHASGVPNYNCTDFDPSSSEQRIELLESAGKPYSTNHFKITGTLTLLRQGIRIRIFGSGGAFIDSTAPNSAFKIPFKSIGFFERVTLTNTAGSAGGRLIENYGELGLYGTTIANGDVTGAQNPSGRGGCIFNGNTSSGLFPATISFAEQSVITGCKAKKGGGIYNDAGVINELAVTLSNNQASQAGGAIYNLSLTPSNTTWTNGIIQSNLTIIQNNKARTGGGVFNRGLVELLDGSSITGNSTLTTGSSGETCTATGTTSCDGFGGGVLSVHTSSSADTRFELQGSALSNNTASSLGGAVYSVGVLELGGNAMNGNRAPDGAAMYVMAPTDGTQQYCNFYGSSGVGAATINSNIANAGKYSIVSGGPGTALDFRACTFGGKPTYLTATGNSSPYCKASALHADSVCPQ